MRPIKMSNIQSTRRRFVVSLALGSAGLFAPGAFAEELIRTKSVEEGPFYPDQLRSTPTTTC
jgi:hypothetical protein